MKAVNLIPGDSRRRGRGGSGLPLGPSYLVLAALGVALVLVTVYVLTTNTISDRKAKVASLQQQVAQAQAEAARLSNYAAFDKLAQARVATVRAIAATRFDWHGALSDLSRVEPSSVSLLSLFGSVSPGATIQGGGSGASSGATATLRGDLTVPAFEMTGCSKSQDDVARLMSRLRLINGVTRVTLGDSQKPNQASTGIASGSSSASSTTCPGDIPKFDLVVFFSPLPGAGPTGPTSLAVSNTTTAPGGSK